LAHEAAGPKDRRGGSSSSDSPAASGLSGAAQVLGSGPRRTLTYYGFVNTAVEDFAIAAMLVGISRIVPIGQALNFDAIWDGYDLLRELTRTVRLS
jgi:hypothetical protein